VASLAAWLLVRMLGASAEGAANEDLPAALADATYGYAVLLVQAAPMLVAVVATANLGPERGARRWFALATAVVVSAGVGAWLRIAVSAGPWDTLVYVWPRYAILGGLLTVAGEFHRFGAAQAAAAQEAEIDRVTLEREMTEAGLQVLQAQIEPHFLFNTLANVRRLYAEDPIVGREMLDSLIRYLETALPRMRHGGSTLERDAELIESFLRIQQIRMGRRLAFSIDIPRGLRSRAVPPMMLMTLVENAVKHGIAPRPRGGLIRVAARVEADHLILSVADTGVGFGSSSGVGIGLANISARLAAEFGDRARLSLENNELGGATATIRLPPDGSDAPEAVPRVRDGIADTLGTGAGARSAGVAAQR
jgi:signal transduction histidine kinase